MLLWLLPILLLTGQKTVVPDDFKIVYEMTTVTEGNENKMETRYFIKGDQVRVESEMGQPFEGSTVVLLNPAATVLLMPGTKSYIDLPQPPKNQSATPPFDLDLKKKTGKMGRVAGIPCEHLEATSGGKFMEFCISRKHPSITQRLHQRMGAGGPVYEKRSDQILLLEHIAREKDKNGKIEFTMRVKELKVEPLDSLLFQIPKDFKKITRDQILHHNGD